MGKRVQFDLNLLAVLLIAVIAALPFLTRPGLPRHTDLELHVYRAAEYSQVLRDGVLYPRWAPDFYYGYGYPIFNYYAPFTYALASLWAVPFGIVAGVKGVVLTAYLLAAVGTYFFAGRHFGSSAGVIASAAFVLSPYLLLIDPLMRGDVAEFFALSLLPWVFLAFDQPDRSIAARSVALAILVFSHNLVALMGAALLVAYLIWRGLFVDGVHRWRSDALAIAFALGLTAIFWLPFFVERNAVRLDVAGAGHFDYHNHFVALSMLLSPSPALDFGATTPKFIYNLGVVQWGLLIPAMAFTFFGRRETGSKIALFFIIAAVFLIFLILPASTFIWDAIPSAAFVQFPWRLLGPAAFALAVCVGAVYSLLITLYASHITSYALRFTLHSSLFILLLATALPTMYPPVWDSNFGDTSPRGMIDFELSGVALGTTSTSDFLPKPVGREPPPAQSLLDSYSSGLVDKFDHSSLPAGATARVEQHRANDDRFQVESPTDFRARIFTFLFPGWHAYVDDTEVSIKPEDQSGFITFPVPAGSHALEVSLQLTMPQIIGTAISALSLVALIALSLIRKPAKASTPSLKLFVSPLLYLSIVGIFLTVKVLIFDRCDACFRYTSPPGQVLGAQYKQIAHFGGQIDLLGYDLPSAEVESGGVLPLTVYWKAAAGVPVNYQVFAHLVRPATILWGQSDKLNPGDFPTTRWPLDKYVWDDHRLQILPGTPPGDYRLSIGLYTLSDGQRAPVVNDVGQIIGDNVMLDTVIHVIRPGNPPPIAALQIQHPIDRDYNGARLLGWSIEATDIVTPNFARTTLFWRSDVDRLTDMPVRGELIDQAGRVVQTAESDFYPMHTWIRNEIIRDQRAFWLPPDFPSGPYGVRLIVGGKEPLNLASIEVKK